MNAAPNYSMAYTYYCISQELEQATPVQIRQRKQKHTEHAHTVSLPWKELPQGLGKNERKEKKKTQFLVKCGGRDYALFGLGLLSIARSAFRLRGRRLHSPAAPANEDTEWGRG